MYRRRYFFKMSFFQINGEAREVVDAHNVHDLLEKLGLLNRRIAVMVNGQIRMSGTGAELLGNEEVRNAYLGGH